MQPAMSICRAPPSWRTCCTLAVHSCACGCLPMGCPQDTGIPLLSGLSGQCSHQPRPCIWIPAASASAKSFDCNSSSQLPSHCQHDCDCIQHCMSHAPTCLDSPKYLPYLQCHLFIASPSPLMRQTGDNLLCIRVGWEDWIQHLHNLRVLDDQRQPLDELSHLRHLLSSPSCLLSMADISSMSRQRRSCCEGQTEHEGSLHPNNVLTLHMTLLFDNNEEIRQAGTTAL